MPRLSRPVVFSLAVLSVVMTGAPLFSAPPAGVSKGPDWGSDAIPNVPPASAASVAPASNGPARGGDKIARSTPAPEPAAPISLTPAAIVYDDHWPAAISEHSLLAVFGKDTWNLKTMTRVGEKLQFPKIDEGLRTVMSADGKFVAVAPSHGRRSVTGVDVTVYDTTTGAKVSDVLSALRDEDVDYVGLAKSPWMLIASRGSPMGDAPMELWNFQTGKIIRRFSCCYWEREGVALSPDGKLVAISNTETTKIYNIETGEAVATMEIPARDIRMGMHIDSNGQTTKVSRVAMSTLTIACLAFSPDGTEVAALASVFGRDEARVICWDTKGKIKDDFVFDTSRRLTPGHAGMLQWSPDGAAFMIKGRWLVDRKFKHIVFGRETVWTDSIKGAFIDPGHYFAAHDDSRKPSEVLELPLESIRKSVAAASDPNVPALLRPGQSVSLQLAMENPRSDEASTRKMILDLVAARLKRDGIFVAENQKTVLSLTFTEDGGAAPATEARGVLEYKIVVHDKDGKEQVHFADRIDERVPAQRGAAAAENRADLLTDIGLDISEMKLPYFIPAQEGLEMLPDRDFEQSEFFEAGRKAAKDAVIGVAPDDLTMGKETL